MGLYGVIQGMKVVTLAVFCGGYPALLVRIGKFADSFPKIAKTQRGILVHVHVRRGILGPG